MAIWNRKKLDESVRITKNTADEDGLYFNQNINITDIVSDTGVINVESLNNFRLLKGERSEKFNSFDIMSQDSRIASILNMYSDDCTQYNQSSQVIWAESSDPNCEAFANRLIDNLQLNKNAWSHIYSLCKYGDLYLELFYDTDLTKGNEVQDLNKSLPLSSYERPRGSRLAEYIEMVKNPAEVFDLVVHGKTAFYIKVNSNEGEFNVGNQKYMYTYTNTENSIILPADKYIHICINDAFTRFPNKYVLKNSETGKEQIYDIKEGTSVLANIYKVWSELNLLEDSLLLNRLSKSAIIRLIQIEVGNTDDNDVREILMSLRDKISRSRYLDKSTGNYKNQANPGPLENIIYHATHKGNGAITHDTIGGDVDVKALADIDYFLEKLAQGFPVPLAYVQMKNDDGGGLSAGTSLTKFDARYGRTLKRYQNAYINGITDTINVFAYKRGLTDYINNFTIKMVSPSAVEDNERDEKLSTHTDMIRNIMDVISSQSGDAGEAYNIATKKEILNYLLRTMLQDSGLNEILQQDMIDNPIEKDDEIEEEINIENEDSSSELRDYNPNTNPKFEEPIETNNEEEIINNEQSESEEGE